MSTVVLDRNLEKLAKAVALVLKDEFGIPFAFWEVTPEIGAQLFARSGSAAEHRPRTTEDLLEVAGSGRSVVRSLPNGYYQLDMPVYRGRKVVLVASGEVAPLVYATEEATSIRERQVLERWLQAVSDRLRLSEQLDGRRNSEEGLYAQVAQSWEALLTVDSTLRHFRPYKEPQRGVQEVLEGALYVVAAEAMIWVPGKPDDETPLSEELYTHTLPPNICGSTRLSLEECRRLGNALSGEMVNPRRPFICNDVPQALWAQPFSGVNSVLVLKARDPARPGWLMALNKKSSASSLAKGGMQEGFRTSDAAVLSPFLSILEMHGRSLSRFLELKELLVGLTRSLTTAIEAKDPYTLGHSERVARIAVELGRRLGIPEMELGDYYLAGLLHDIGKIGVHDSLLRKPGKLTVEEYEQVKEHVGIGYAILSDLRSIRNMLPGVLYHHEKYDGSGYPDGLKAEDIPILARVIAVADAYDSMTSERPYREALSCSEVEERFKQGAGTHWDPRVVDALMKARQAIHAIRQSGIGESLRVAIEGALRSIPHE